MRARDRQEQWRKERRDEDRRRKNEEDYKRENGSGKTAANLRGPSARNKSLRKSLPEPGARATRRFIELNLTRSERERRMVEPRVLERWTSTRAWHRTKNVRLGKRTRGDGQCRTKKGNERRGGENEACLARRTEVNNNRRNDDTEKEENRREE